MLNLAILNTFAPSFYVECILKFTGVNDGE